MTKNIVIIILALVVAYFIWYTSTRKCFDLPTTGTPARWGGKYWTALHEIGDRIPCQECREKGSSFLVFMHDIVNRKLSKPMKSPENFSWWVNYIKNMPDTLPSATETTSKA